MALSQGALQAVLASATEKVFLECLTITHSEIDTIRLVNDSVNLTRSIGEYFHFPFSVTAATQNQDTPPALNITADAVNQTLVLNLRQLAGKRENPKITYEIVLADSPDTIEFGPVEFEYEGISGDSSTQVTVRAGYLKGALNDAFPARQFAPSNVSG